MTRFVEVIGFLSGQRPPPTPSPSFNSLLDPTVRRNLGQRRRERRLRSRRGYGSSGGGGWESLRVVTALVGATLFLLRSQVALWPHSGMNTPPRYGDFEAQRHWLELTTALPVDEWYRNSTRNDLSYWGLDYPPLTAYHAWGCGKLLAA